MEWQPIATAPKTGVEILFFDSVNSFQHICFWDKQYSCWKSLFTTLYDGKPENPTHWMHLPPPPTQ